MPKKAPEMLVLIIKIYWNEVEENSLQYSAYNNLQIKNINFLPDSKLEKCLQYDDLRNKQVIKIGEHSYYQYMPFLFYSCQNTCIVHIIDNIVI